MDITLFLLVLLSKAFVIGTERFYSCVPVYVCPVCVCVSVCVCVCECVCVFVCVCNTHVEGELSREVVHATGVHETQGVPHSFGVQHTLACDWTEAAVGQRGSHDTGALARHLD